MNETRQRKLSPVEERFAVALAEGCSQAQAYRIANPKSVHWKPSTLYTKASELMSEERMQERLAELQRDLAARSLWSREESVRALRGVIENPERKSDIIAAVRELNAMHGFHAPQRLEHSGAIVAIERRIIDVVVAEGVEVAALPGRANEDVAAKALPGKASEDTRSSATALPYELPEASRP